MINFRFVEGGGWDSKIIRWDTRCKWSHVECIPGFPTNKQTIGAMLDGGVKLRSFDDRDYKKAVAYKIWSISTTANREKLFYDFVNSQIGQPYDWQAIVSFGLGERDWRKDGRWFCSELMARGLEVAGILKLAEDQPVWRITPRDVWILAAALQGAGMAISSKKIMLPKAA
jgi:uncharacterized protein YycO